MHTYVDFSSDLFYRRNFPGDSDSKTSAYNVGDPGSIPGLGRSSGEGNGNPLQYSCLENPVDRGTCQATVHGISRVRHNLATKPIHYMENVSLCK